MGGQAEGSPDWGSVTNFRLVLELFTGRVLPDWPVVEATRVVRDLAPGDDLFDSAQALDRIHLVRRGCLFVEVRPAGRDEWTLMDLPQEGELVVHPAAGLSTAPIRHLVQSGVMPRLKPLAGLLDGRLEVRAVAAEPTVLIGFDLAVIRSLADRHVAWAQALIACFSLNGAVAFARLLELRTRSVEQRYADLRREQPRLVGRLRQKDLARYLGVSESGLSRIHRRSQEER